MKKYLLSSLAVVSIVAMATSASAGFMGIPVQGSYGLVEGGYSFGKTRVGDAGILGVGGGYQINQWLRSDMILSYRGWGDVDLRSTTGTKNDVWSIPLMFNAYATMPVYKGFGVYAMAGLGASYNKTDSGYLSGGKGKFDFAWNAGAGVEYIFNNCWTVDLGYRYTDLGDAQVKMRDGYDGRKRAGLKSNDVKLTLRYIF